jgi:hypothetical protein
MWPCQPWQWTSDQCQVKVFVLNMHIKVLPIVGAVYSPFGSETFLNLGAWRTPDAGCGLEMDYKSV